jgi:hypothetical protein
MDSGLGSIGRKLVQWIPFGNSLCLIVFFYILNFHFNPSESVGQYAFENYRLRLCSGFLIYVIPILLFLNSFLFRRIRHKTVNATISLILIAYLVSSLMMSVFISIVTFDGGTALIRRSITPNGQIISLRERLVLDLSPGEQTRCRYHIRQRRVFPGILRTEAREKEVCLWGSPLKSTDFPPNLQ